MSATAAGADFASGFAASANAGTGATGCAAGGSAIARAPVSRLSEGGGEPATDERNRSASRTSWRALASGFERSSRRKSSLRTSGPVGGTSIGGCCADETGEGEGSLRAHPLVMRANAAPAINENRAAAAVVREESGRFIVLSPSIRLRQDKRRGIRERVKRETFFRRLLVRGGGRCRS